MSQVSLARLKLSRVKPLVGRSAKKTARICYAMLENTRIPLYLVGPSGSGKTITAMNLAKQYAINNGVPAYYIQLSPDQTKTSIILGLRLVEGSLTAVKGVVATAMEEGGVVIVDETTHGTQELLLMFNSIMDPTSVTSIGDTIVYAKPTFRLIFCSNSSSYAANVRLPQSFAQRVSPFYFGYPAAADELLVVRSIIETEFSDSDLIPDSLIKFLTAYVQEYRTDIYPLTARNVALAAIRCALTLGVDFEEVTDADGINRYFTGQNAESISRRIFLRLMGRQSTTADELNHEDVQNFKRYISKIGVDAFRDIIAASMLVHLDIEGSELNQGVQRQNLIGGII